MAAALPIDTSVDWLRLSCIMALGENILRYILKCGTNAPSTSISLQQYLDTLDQHSNANYCQLSNKEKKKIFNRDELNQISADLTWDRFDMSFSWKAIRHACENVAPLNDSAWWDDTDSLESLVTKIKKERNVIVHERPQFLPREFEAKVREVKDLFMKALKAAQTRYSVSDHEINNEKYKIKEGIERILGCFKIEEMCQDSIKLFETFKDMLVSCLRSVYDREQIFDPLCFLSGSPQTSLRIQDIFSRISVKEKEERISMKEKEENVEIPHLKIIGHAQSLGRASQLNSQLLLIKGRAGSGKTTLLTYILTEWLRDECDRQIEHLDKYDLVIHIKCRERNGDSLEEFLKLLFPGVVAFSHKTMTLLTKCRILFLIDGLDECNSSSRRLVQDVLTQGRRVPGFTILCTSRPEAAGGFVRSAPREYGKGEVVMEGITPDDRTKFVLKYYKCLSGSGACNPGRVEQVMESIGWRDQFKLPLNLLFLATLFHDDLNSVKVNTTQTGLYMTTLQWCEEKLQDRLALNQQSRHIDEESRKEGIRRVLGILGRIALEGILHDRLSISDEELTQLRECCRMENLPSKEVLGAFYSSCESVVNRVVHQAYYAPHKGIQEFHGARHIVKHLLESSSGGSILQLLQDTSREPLRLSNLINLLLHVLGLLSQPDMPPLPQAMKEVVDLLVEAGVKHCNTWLHVLEDTEVNTIVLENVAQYITRKGSDYVFISDSAVTSATALLPRIPRKVVLEIELKRKEVLIENLSRATANHDLLSLYLQHHFRHPDLPPASDSILHALPRRNLKWFLGHLSGDGIMLLQESLRLKVLYLAMSGNHDSPSIMSALSALHPSSIDSLRRLGLHIPVQTVSPEVFTTPLPQVINSDGYPGLALLLSGVDERVLDKTITILTTLQPKEYGYCVIMFPGCRIDAGVWKDVLTMFGDKGVRVWKDGVWVPDTITMTEGEEEKLCTLARTMGMSGFRRASDLVAAFSQYYR